jgi:hypothetical protein
MERLKQSFRGHFGLIRLLAVLISLLLWAWTPGKFLAATKLYLKDGTYQLVKSYEVRGDRVRYYSVERSEWEEIPVSLIDFDATRRAKQEEQEAKARAIERAKQIEQKHISQRVVASGYEVSPGVRLPNDQGIFAFDGKRIMPLVQSDSEQVTDRKRLALNVAVPAPILKHQSQVVLSGPKAAVRFQDPQLTFFVRLPNSTAANLELIPVKSGKHFRIVERVNVGFKGKAKESRRSIPLRRTQVAPDIYKLQPLQPLSSDEYALAEVKDGKMNLDVWDFGIDSPH